MVLESGCGILPASNIARKPTKTSWLTAGRRDVIICKSERISGSLLDRLDDLKLIVILSTRYDNVDLDGAARNGVLVVNNMSYWRQYVLPTIRAL